MGNPLVSVVTATYNRSNVLVLAIESVCWQSFSKWELIVVGDACTDDTEAIVTAKAIEDPRIRFINLEQNVGEQSGPNNAGCRMARGDFIAFLNHDDLWLPDHLERLLQAINGSLQPDIVTGGILAVPPEPNAIPQLTRMRPVSRLDAPGGMPASAWLFRRELFDTLGGWRFYQECFSMPSQDWLFRVWKTGRQIIIVPEFTVVAFFSGQRHNAYAHRIAAENHRYFDLISDNPNFREQQMRRMGYTSIEEVIARQIKDYAAWRPNPPLWSWPLRYLRRLASRLLVLLRVDPQMVANLLRYRRRGGFIDILRRRRGLKKLRP